MKDVVLYRKDWGYKGFAGGEVFALYRQDLSSRMDEVPVDVDITRWSRYWQEAFNG
jgi:hypothetical protein